MTNIDVSDEELVIILKNRIEKQFEKIEGAEWTKKDFLKFVDNINMLKEIGFKTLVNFEEINKKMKMIGNKNNPDHITKNIPLNMINLKFNQRKIPQKFEPIIIEKINKKEEQKTIKLEKELVLEIIEDKIFIKEDNIESGFFCYEKQNYHLAKIDEIQEAKFWKCEKDYYVKDVNKTVEYPLSLNQYNKYNKLNNFFVYICAPVELTNVTKYDYVVQ
ncbi:MAG: hypothetical protein ACRC4M_02725 [Mycoplasma sp.]